MGHRVLAGVRDSTAPWTGQEEAILSIPLTDGGHVLTLSGDDRIETLLTAQQLREAFATAGMTLWLDGGDADDGTGGDEASGDFDETLEPFGDDHFSDTVPGDEIEFEPSAVQVFGFSHRGITASRILAVLNRASVEHIESGQWSLQRSQSTEPTTMAEEASRAESPVIELNRVDAGDDWITVATGRSGDGIMPFWPGAERDTQPVFDIAAITVTETAEVYRRLLTEGDGSRDELLQIAASSPLDVDAAHAALIPEALGGIVGEEARERAFLSAFGIPEDLIAAALDGETTLAVQRFEPTGWPVAVREALIDGMSGMTPLTRRDRPIARLTRSLRSRPNLSAAVSVGELTLGMVASRFRGFGRVLGVLLIVDAVVDLVILGVRMRRR